MNLIHQFPEIKILQDLAGEQKRRVFLVGGFLRDHVLKRPVNDLDFAVDKGALRLAELFAARIKGKYILLDQEHNCARVAKKVKGVLLTYDFADYRAGDYQADLASRDFTINTLSVDINALKADDELDAVILDSKRGMKDILGKRIKRTSIRALKDDPLRMMRAFSLKANLGFKIELETLNQIRKEKDLLRSVSYERIREELFKVLESDQSADILKSMDKVGLLELIIPQVHVMFGCKQGGYHHLDVWPHSLEVVRQLDKIFRENRDPEIDEYSRRVIGGGHSRRSVMKLAALLHDIGKPDTRKKEGERISFHGHENVGKNIAKSVARMLKLSTQERHVLEDMVLWHLRPGYLSNYKKPSERMVYRFLRDTGEEAAGVLLLSLADQRSTRGPLTTESDQKHHESICTGLVKTFFEKKKELPYVPLLNGNDIMKKLKLESSPLIGKILVEVREQHSLGKLKTREEALELARKMAEAAG